MQHTQKLCKHPQRLKVLHASASEYKNIILNFQHLYPVIVQDDGVKIVKCISVSAQFT